MSNDKKIFRFSEPFYKAYFIENVQNHELKNKTIVLNLGEDSVLIAGQQPNPLKSSIYSGVVIKKADKLVCIEADTDSNLAGSLKFSGELKKKWQHVHEVFHLPHLEKVRLWRSLKEKFGDFEFNLWFAPAGTDCGLHNKHDFRELHTQIYGLGRMQKFRENDKKTLYSEVFMDPGYTHDPFYDMDGIYPWHQYYADSDCLWLATEFK